MPNENTWHPRGVRSKQVSPQEAGWILGDEAVKHAERRQAQLAEVEHLARPTEDIPPPVEQTEKPAVDSSVPKRERKTAVKKNAAPKKTGPSSAPKKTKGPKA